MSQDNAVQFLTKSRIHMGLAIRDLNASIAFYSILFGQDPSKVRLGYAKFEVPEPPVNLSLNQIAGETGPSNSVTHYGIQVKSTQAVDDFAKRLAENGLPMRTEQVTCCYAVQNKIWISDPDGNKWEVYVVLDDNEIQHSSSESSCCTEPSGTTQCCQPSPPINTTTAKAGCCCVTN